MALPKRVLEDDTHMGKIDGRDIGVSKWFTADQVVSLQEKIKTFEPNYHPDFQNRSHLQQRPIIQEFFDSLDNCQMTEFSFELCLCGKDACTICQQIGRTVETPNVSVGKHNLREELLWFTTMPIPNPMDPKHFLSPQDNHEFVEKKKPSLEILKSYIPNTNINSKGANQFPLQSSMTKLKISITQKFKEW